jgi:hypothetical protein
VSRSTCLTPVPPSDASLFHESINPNLQLATFNLQPFPPWQLFFQRVQFVTDTSAGIPLFSGIYAFGKPDANHHPDRSRRRSRTQSRSLRMSAKTSAKPAEWTELRTRPATQGIWEASEFKTKSNALVQGPPVQVRLRAGLAELSVNTQSASEVQLLDDRDLLLQCGEALFHLKLVLQRFGRIGQAQLFPNLDHLSLVAKIPCEFNCDTDVLESVAMNELFRHRHEFISTTETPVSNQVLARLAMVGTNGRAWLDFSQSGLSRQQLCDIETSSHSCEESQSQTAATGPGLREAITDALGFFGVGRLGSLLLGTPTRNLTVDSTYKAPDGIKTIHEMGSLAVLKTKTDDRYGWLAAGEVMGRARLEAQTLGVSSQVFDQAFRERRPRQELRNIIGRKGFVQAIIGFGSRSLTDANSGFALPSSTQPPASPAPSQIQMKMSS